MEVNGVGAEVRGIKEEGNEGLKVAEANWVVGVANECSSAE